MAGFQPRSGVNHMLHQCTPGQSVQHFGQPAFHAGALAGGHDHYIHCCHTKPPALMAIFTKLMRIIGLLAMAWLALTACSAVKLGYGALPELAFWRLDAYLDFDDAQAAQVRDGWTALHQWHRSTELPRYAALLEQAERLAPADITRPRPAPAGSGARTHVRPLAQQAEPAMAATAPA
jgi:hypothetical protein